MSLITHAKGADGIRANLGGSRMLHFVAGGAGERWSAVTIRFKRRPATQAVALALAMAFAGQTGTAAQDAPRRTLVDPPADEPRNTHAYLRLTGPAARRLFDAIKGKVAADACEEGRRSKAAGNVVCSVGTKAKDAHCDFAIDTRSGMIAEGPPC
jgi:hypothetical protein